MKTLWKNKQKTCRQKRYQVKNKDNIYLNEEQVEELQDELEDKLEDENDSEDDDYDEDDDDQYNNIRLVKYYIVF